VAHNAGWKAMLALVSAAITTGAAEALAAERSWELQHVRSVRDAVAVMPPELRASVRALIVETEHVGEDLLGQLPELELIACLRSDPVNVDVGAATARNIPVVHTPGRNAEAVADFTLGLCLAAVRSIAISHHQIVSGELTTSQPSPGVNAGAGNDVIWRPENPRAPIPYLVFKGRELSGLVVGVVGFGWVGQAVARRFAGLVREVHIADPAVAVEVIRERGYIPATLAQLLAAADVVTIHARSAATLIGRGELRRMKRGSVLINAARATVLDYDALLESLDSGHLRAAALDVFPEEPIPSSSPLRKQRNLTLTPHLAGSTVDVIGRQSEILLAAVRGLYDRNDADSSRGLLPVRNPEVRPRKAASRPGEAGAVRRA
jgi:D-3-phosphoglycerate dehydrogenase / 2-oxoglutarate reductase